MTTQCPSCLSTHIENNICKKCKYHVFSFYDDLNLNNQNSDYFKLIDFLVEKTKLNTKIIKNIIQLNFLHILPYYKFDHDNLNKKTFAFPNLHIYPDNYKKTLEFFFASFNFYNPQYKLIIFNNYDPNTYVLSISENENDLFIDLAYDYKTNQKVLYINRQYIESESIPYDINILNSTEYRRFSNQLEIQSDEIRNDELNNNYNVDLLSYSVMFDCCFICNKLDIDFSKDFNLIHSNIEKQIQTFVGNVEKLMTFYKEKNAVFFERALTEIQIAGF